MIQPWGGQGGGQGWLPVRGDTLSSELRCAMFIKENRRGKRMGRGRILTALRMLLGETSHHFKWSQMSLAENFPWIEHRVRVGVADFPMVWLSFPCEYGVKESKVERGA